MIEMQVLFGFASNVYRTKQAVPGSKSESGNES